MDKASLTTSEAVRDTGRRKGPIPDSAHGTNPASAAMAGFDVVELASDADGNVDLAALHAVAGDDLAGVMITVPRSLGLFDTHIVDVCRIVHQAGGLVYGDGANMNALLGRVKLGDLGFDVIHLNLHKTFSTPHGGGGPGAGPVCAAPMLRPFLPTPVVINTNEDSGPSFTLSKPENSIGRMSGFHGNFGVLVRAYIHPDTGRRRYQIHQQQRRIERQLSDASSERHLLSSLRPNVHA